MAARRLARDESVFTGSNDSNAATQKRKNANRRNARMQKRGTSVWQPRAGEVPDAHQRACRKTRIQIDTSNNAQRHSRQGKRSAGTVSTASDGHFCVSAFLRS